MKFTKLLTAGALTASLISPALMADDNTTPTMSDAQKREVEKVVHDYLVSNPDVLLEASQALQKKQQEVAQEQAKSAIKENTSDLLQGKLTVVGNPKGNVTVVEFFDYPSIVKKWHRFLKD